VQTFEVVGGWRRIVDRTALLLRGEDVDRQRHLVRRGAPRRALHSPITTRIFKRSPPVPTSTPTKTPTADQHVDPASDSTRRPNGDRQTDHGPPRPRTRLYFKPRRRNTGSIAGERDMDQTRRSHPTADRDFRCHHATAVVAPPDPRPHRTRTATVEPATSTATATPPRPRTPPPGQCRGDVDRDGRRLGRYRIGRSTPSTAPTAPPLFESSRGPQPQRDRRIHRLLYRAAVVLDPGLPVRASPGRGAPAPLACRGGRQGRPQGPAATKSRPRGGRGELDQARPSPSRPDPRARSDILIGSSPPLVTFNRDRLGIGSGLGSDPAPPPCIEALIFPRMKQATSSVDYARRPMIRISRLTE